MKKNYILLAAIILFFQYSLSGQTVYFWEQFDGSANGWVSDPVSPLDSSFWNWSSNEWEWSPNGDPSSGLFWTPVTLILSETQANGSMIFNADYYSTQGINGNIPPSPYVQFVCHLVSPPIDLSAADPSEALRLQFTQFVRYLNISDGAPNDLRISASWSTDGGATWSEPVDVSQDGPGVTANVPGVNQAINGDIVSVNLPTGIQSNPDVRVRLTWASQFYFWIVDDIKITSRPDHNMRANPFYAIAPNFMTPASQVEPFGFLCDIENLGGAPQTNVNLNITIKDNATSTTVYTDDTDYGTIGVDSVAENVSFGSFTPPASPGSYIGTYTVSADSTDLDPDNNTQEFLFQISDTTFAKELEPDDYVYPAAANWDEGDPHSWVWGNHFYVPNGDGWYANSASFSIDVTEDPNAEGQTVRIVLYEWDNENVDEYVDPGERTDIGSFFYVMDGNEEFDEVHTVPLTDIFTNLTPELKDDTHYVICIEFSAEDETQVWFGASSALDYDAMRLGTEQQGAPRFDGFLGIAGNLAEESFSPYGFTGGSYVPVVRLHIGETPIFSSTKELLNPAETVKISPNPANDYVQFDVTLKETASLLRVELLDVTGKSLGLQEFRNAKEANTTFNTAHLTNGSYFVRIDTDFGYTTERFVVQK